MQEIRAAPSKFLVELLSAGRGGTMTRRGFRSSAVLVVIGLGAFVPSPALSISSPCSDPQSSLTEPVELCGETVLTGEAAGVVRVRLSEAAQIDSTMGASGTFEIEGRGEFVGLAMIEDRPGRDGIGFVAALTGEGSERSPVFIAFGGLSSDPNACVACTLPIGEYRLYLAAESSASVTVRFGGLSGSVGLSPTTGAFFRTFGGYDRYYYFGHNLIAASAGAVWTLPNPGFLYRRITLLEGPVARFGVCRYDGDPMDGFFWECPLADERVARVSSALDTYPLALSDYDVPVPPGRYAQAAWFEAVPLAANEMVGAWLSFD